MRSHPPSRLCLGAAVVMLFAAASAFARGPKVVPPPPAFRQNRPEQRPGMRPGQNGGGRPVGRAGQNEQHLAQWMDSHKNLSLADQQHALQNEPGFRELPAWSQQRELNDLARLYNMNPQQRSRRLDRTEALEHMSPQQVQQYNGAVQSFAMTPLDRRRVMARAIVDLREMSPQQREQVINSPAFGTQFSDGERATIRTLLTAEPYPASRAPNEGP